MNLSILLRDFVPIITFHINWKAKVDEDISFLIYDFLLE